MARQKKEKDTTDAIANLNINSTVDNKIYTSLARLAGTKVSLNQKSETFLGVAGLWFTPENYCHTLPQTLTTEQEIEIHELISNGVLISGDVRIRPLDKDKSVLDEYWTLLKIEGFDVQNRKSKSTKRFRALLRMPIDRNWTAKEICKYCIEQETKYKNRREIIRLLNDLAINAECPDFLQEN